MGNTRPGASPRDGGGGSSVARGNAVPRTRASGSPTILTMRNSATESVMDTIHWPARGGPVTTSSKRSSWNTPTSSRGTWSARLGNMATRSSDDEQQKGAAARHGVSKMIQNNASNSSSLRDSKRTPSSSTSSKKGAKKQMTEHDRIENVSISSKKRKRMDTRSYRALFKPSIKANATDVVVATPDIVGKENTTSGHVADSNIGILCEGDRLIGKNKRHSSNPVCKVSKSPISVSHETSETRVDQCTPPFSEVQPHKHTDTCPQNKVAESSLAVEARDQHTGPARQCLSSLQSAPISPIHHEETKSALGDGESISIQKKDSASRQIKVAPSDETDGDSNICVVCGTPGILKSCDGKGCKRRYHISCLDPSLESLSPGIRFCTICTKKRLQFGIHSIVDEIESVWDVKEGIQNGKQYFVKYKNLAHVHNRWVPEADIVNDTSGGPDRLSLFNTMRNHKEKTSWKEEWTEPHCLLRKRLLIPPKLGDDLSCSPGANFAYCNAEWLVKWRGLGYDHATWELETSPFLCTHEANELKKNYENRREAAKQSSIPTKAKKVKKSPFQKLERLPDGWHPVFDNDHLYSINQLREFWYKSYGAVLVDDKDRVIKTILFTMSVLPDVCQPFLIVTTPTSLSLWEVQFSHFAPFINVVVYDGGKDMLKLIQDLEFCENGSCIMLQVLLSHSDAILEDIDTIGRIGWEAVIVDYYQNSAPKYLEQLKQLSTDFRVLLLSSPIKDNLPEYINLLAFLNSGEEDNSDYVDTADALVMSKARFTRHIAYERKEDSSNFMEHWVPAYISQVQLKIYCSILLSNSSVLQSQMKSGSVGALCDIFLSLSKCCDHPYLVDEFPQSSLVNNHNVTDTRVHASGKLLLLDKMLKEIRNKRLRVIILFQSGGTGGNPMGNILEDVVRHRFGPESYERVECGAVMSRKQAAMNIFNDKTNGRFVFLIDNRACLPSIKLSSIDCIIIYGSDWNPLNDLKALQKIKIESQFKYVSIFRLYTPFTVEEKSLVLAKQGMLIDSNIQNIMPSLSHSLLSWGASFLFNNFDELQQDNYASIISERGTLFMDNVISEFLTKLSTNVEDSTDINSVCISEANMSGEFYSRNITLIGEKERMSALDGDPSTLWLNLLDGKSWSYISEPQQSSHRMLQNMEEPAKVPAEGTDEATRKRRKVGEITGSSSKVLSDNYNDNACPENCTALRPALQPFDDTHQKLGVENLMSTPKNLHIQLKQELSKLIKVLQLPDNVSILVEQFFEHLLKNHLVAREPKGILHALNIALCWRVASLLNYKVDRRESLALAEKCLNYEYNEELAGLVYDKLRTLKKKFPRKAGEASRKCHLMLVENNKLSLQETSINLRNDHMFPKKAMDLHGNFTNGAPQGGSFGAGQMVSEVQELISVPETHKEYHLSSDELPDVIAEKRLDLVENVFSLREKNILHKQQLEISELEAHTQNKVMGLKEVCNLVLEYIRTSHIDEETRNDKTKLIVQWFTMLMYAFLEHMRLQHSKLEALQSSTWSKERQLKDTLQQEAKSGQLDQTFYQRIPLPDSSFVMEEFIHFKEKNDYYHIVESSVSDCQQPSNDKLIMEITLVQNVVPSEPISTRAVRNGSADALEDSGGGPASEVVDFPENIIRCSSDGIGLQRAGCSSSAILANDDSINQESSTGECRSTEHVERDIIANPSMLLGGAASIVMGVDANNDGTVDADRVHLELPILASSQSLVTLLVSREVGNQANLSPMSAQQTVETSQHPPAEVEPTNLGVMADRDLQLEVQTPTSTLDAPFQRTCPDDTSQTGHQPDTTTGLLQEVTTSYHLALGDVSMGVKAKNDGTVAADPLHSETQSYTAPHNPAAMAVAREVETETYQLSMPAQQITSLQPQQRLATPGHPPAEAEPSSILGMEVARDLQPGMQPSASMSDAPLQRMHPDDSSQTGHQPGTASGLSQGGGTSSHLGDVRKGVDANNSDTVCADQAHSETPSFAAPHSPAIFPVSTHAVTRANLSSMYSQESTDLFARQNVAPSRRQPAEAERIGLLGTQAARDLQPEMQPSMSFPDAPLQRMQPDDRSQTGCQPDTATGLSQGGSATSHHLGDVRMGVMAKNGGNVPADPLHSESLTYTAHNPATLPVSTEVETQTCQSSLPAQQSTSPPAQQSLAISRHPPAEAEPAGILGTEAAQDLQPEMQPSTSMRDQPEEADQAGILGTSEAWGLQPEIQPSTSTQDVPFERIYLSRMPVLRSMTVHESVEPIWDQHAGVEPSGTLGTVTAHDLQSEIQPSASMQDRSAEAEGAGMSGTTAGQDLQPEMQPATTMQHLPLERTHSEDRSQIGFQSNMAPGPEQPSQLLPVAMMMSSYRVHSDEPLANELEKLKSCSITLNKSHEQKKSQLLIEYNQQLEKVKRKYDSLLQEEDSNYLQSKMELDNLYWKVFVNQSLAENFQGKFMLSTAAQGRSTSPVIVQPLQSSQQAHARTSASQTIASPVASSSATRPQVFTSFHSPGPNVQPSLVARPSSSRAVQPQSILPGNLYRATSSPFVRKRWPHGSYRAAGAQTRAPAPHLQRPRMQPPYAMVHTNQQQLPVTSLRQFAPGYPGIMENFASTGPQAGALLTSMIPNSIHQTMSPASISRPALPASSLPSGPLPEFMSNFVQSSSSNPILVATQQPSSPNIVLHSTSGALDAAPGSRNAGAQIAGVNQSGSEPASLNAWLTTRLGLTSDPTGTGTSVEVVSLSDDES